LLHLFRGSALLAQAIALIAATAFNFSFHHIFTYHHVRRRTNHTSIWTAQVGDHSVLGQTSVSNTAKSADADGQSQSSVIQWTLFLIAAILLIAVLALGASKLVPNPRVSSDGAKSAGSEPDLSPQPGFSPQPGSSKLALSYQTYV